MNLRLAVSCFAACALVGAPAVAFAQQPCPPGSWFCEETPPPPPPAPPAAPPPAPAGQPQVVTNGGTTVVVVNQGAPQPSYPQPTYQPYQPQPGYQPQPYQPQPGYQPQPYQPQPGYQPGRPVLVRPRPMQNHFGLSLRASGAFFAADETQDAGLVGLGASFRYRPLPWFAVEGGLDVLGGRDFQGFDRVEVPMSASAMFFFNPFSRYQVYGLVGAHASHAWVSSPSWAPQLTSRDDGTYGAEFDYLGGHAGFGAEYRFGPRFGIHFDVLAFVRQRQAKEGEVPEFIATDGRTTNVSGGGLMRAGVNFWW